MKIVIITPILFDKSSPFNHLMYDILQGLIDGGHSVTRIVAVENETDTDYKMGLDKIEYIPVRRKKSPRANIIKRYLTDTATNVKMAKLLRGIKADVLFEDVSYSSFWSIRAAKKVGMKVVSMLQDVWPDNAVQTGLIKNNSLIYRYFEFWQKQVYRKSDRLICISDDMKAFVSSKGVPSKKIDVIYNWGYSDETVDIPWEKNAFAEKYHLSEDLFYAIYAGNIGRMQNVELIVKAAKRLKDNANIRFLIIGDGVYKEEIEKTAAEINLSNITFLPLQPAELATSVYCAADINLITLVPSGIKTALPSKTGVCLSCGRPVIMAVERESAFAVHIEGKCGAVVSPDDPSELAEKIKQLSETDNELYRVGAHSCFTELFQKSANVNKYVKSIIE